MDTLTRGPSPSPHPCVTATKTQAGEGRAIRPSEPASERLDCGPLGCSALGSPPYYLSCPRVWFPGLVLETCAQKQAKVRCPPAHPHPPDCEWTPASAPEPTGPQCCATPGEAGWGPPHRVAGWGPPTEWPHGQSMFIGRCRDPGGLKIFLCLSVFL